MLNFSLFPNPITEIPNVIPNPKPTHKLRVFAFVLFSFYPYFFPEAHPVGVYMTIGLKNRQTDHSTLRKALVTGKKADGWSEDVSNTQHKTLHRSRLSLSSSSIVRSCTRIRGAYSRVTRGT